MTLIITFSKKKKKWKKNVTFDPRHGTLALDMEPSTLDPRQKDRLYSGMDKTTDLVTVFDAILTSRQTREKLQCLYENAMSGAHQI